MSTLAVLALSVEKRVTTHPIRALKPPHAIKVYNDYRVFKKFFGMSGSFFGSKIVYERNIEIVSHKMSL